ncbi:MAG: hypothetical protein JNJ51_03445 [Methylobacillus glycogenes]|nr:hypothetical protein [Methylobacillus glycogenes]
MSHLMIVIGVTVFLMLLWLDYYTLNKASQIYLKVKQNNKTLLLALLWSVLLTTILSLLLPDSIFTVSAQKKVSLSPYYLLYLIIPALVYQILLRNQQGQKLSFKQTLGLYTIKFALFTLAIIIPLLGAFFIFMMMFKDS